MLKVVTEGRCPGAWYRKDLSSQLSAPAPSALGRVSIQTLNAAGGGRDPDWFHPSQRSSHGAAKVSSQVHYRRAQPIFLSFSPTIVISTKYPACYIPSQHCLQRAPAMIAGIRRSLPKQVADAGLEQDHSPGRNLSLTVGGAQSAMAQDDDGPIVKPSPVVNWDHAGRRAP